MAWFGDSLSSLSNLKGQIQSFTRDVLSDGIVEEIGAYTGVTVLVVVAVAFVRRECANRRAEYRLRLSDDGSALPTENGGSFNNWREYWLRRAFQVPRETIESVGSARAKGSSRRVSWNRNRRRSGLPDFEVISINKYFEYDVPSRRSDETSLAPI